MRTMFLFITLFMTACGAPMPEDEPQMLAAQPKTEVRILAVAPPRVFDFLPEVLPARERVQVVFTGSPLREDVPALALEWLEVDGVPVGDKLRVAGFRRQSSDSGILDVEVTAAAFGGVYRLCYLPAKACLDHALLVGPFGY